MAQVTRRCAHDTFEDRCRRSRRPIAALRLESVGGAAPNEARRRNRDRRGAALGGKPRTLPSRRPGVPPLRRWPARSKAWCDFRMGSGAPALNAQSVPRRRPWCRAHASRAHTHRDRASPSPARSDAQPRRTHRPVPRPRTHAKRPAAGLTAPSAIQPRGVAEAASVRPRCLAVVPCSRPGSKPDAICITSDARSLNDHQGRVDLMRHGGRCRRECFRDLSARRGSGHHLPRSQGIGQCSPASYGRAGVGRPASFLCACREARPWFA